MERLCLHSASGSGHTAADCPVRLAWHGVPLSRKISLGVWHKRPISQHERCNVPALALPGSEQIAARSAEGKVRFGGDWNLTWLYYWSIVKIPWDRRERKSVRLPTKYLIKSIWKSELKLSGFVPILKLLLPLVKEFKRLLIIPKAAATYH